MLDGMLDESLDLVTIQISENAVDITSFESDLKEMVEYIMERTPKAQIILIDDFWNSGEKSEAKKRVSSALGVDLLDLGEIRDRKEYQSEIGAVVYDKDGGEHIVEHSGVAVHPNDEGMKYIASGLYSLVR